MNRCLELLLQVPESVSRCRRRYMHETAERHGSILLRVNVEETYCENRNSQGGFTSDARPSCYSPATVLPLVVRPLAPHAIASSNNELRGNRHSSSNCEESLSGDALLDAQDAGDVDRDGEFIPWPKYRSC